MTDDRDGTIDRLVGALEPVRWPGDVRRRFLVFWLVGWAAVFGLTWASGPFRPGALDDLARHPHFLLESALGLLAGGGVGFAAMRLGVPGLPRRALVTRVAIALAALSVAAYGLALILPALEPSMAGKREDCEHQTLVFGTLALLAGLPILRGLAPLHRARAGALLGAAAGAIPALLMQFACMYVPEHILSHHIAPVLGVVVIGAVLGRLVLRRI